MNHEMLAGEIGGGGGPLENDLKLIRNIAFEPKIVFLIK